MDNIDTIAWTAERGTPWHKKGTAVNGLMTSEEALKLGGLDWEVECRPIFTTFGNKDVKIDNKFATIRTDTGYPLGVVGNQYYPIQNREAFSFFDSVVESSGSKYEVVGSLGNGENVWLLVKLSDVIAIKNTDDIVNKYLLLTNNHDGTRTLKMFVTPIRVVCWNTLSAALYGEKFDINGNKISGVSIRHTVNYALKLEEAKKLLNIGTESYRKLNAYFNVLAEKQVNSKWIKEYINNITFIPTEQKKVPSTRIKNVQKQIINLVDHETNTLRGIRGTAWAVYNAATYFADHESRLSKKFRTNENLANEARLNNSWFGTGANFKVRALNTALKMV